MKILFIHAHFDDYEFTAAGTFELWRRKLGKDLRARVIICTDGKAGHQFRTREETGRMRLREQEESARIGGYEFRPLRLRNGEMPREGCLQMDTEFLAALWNEIRDFQPDYLFCPPVITDPLAGIHIDHVAVAEAVRRVAYMINVPHCYTPEYPADETKSAQVKVPVILNVYDPYMKSSNIDFAVDIEDALDIVCKMAYCHKSQILEWLPWVASPTVVHVPNSLADMEKELRRRHEERNAKLGISSRLLELFTVTRWGSTPTVPQLLKDFPNIAKDSSRLAQLAERLKD